MSRLQHPADLTEVRQAVLAGHPFEQSGEIRGRSPCMMLGVSSDIRIGTAGWSIPSASADRAPFEGAHLQRYAHVLTCAEINSSFHRPHRANVYARWAASTPQDFRFAVKLPRTVTHDLRLRGTGNRLDAFFEECAGLGEKLSVVLMQLPPSFAFDRRVAATFLRALRQRFANHIVCEPRHESWLSPSAESLLRDHRVARAAADPARARGFEQPGGWDGLLYLRLHGSPRTYWSSYDAARLAAYAQTIANSHAVERWCIFDNTASGAAFGNALDLRALLLPSPAK